MDSRPNKKRTVLLIEEHQDCRNATKSLLSVSGYECLDLELTDDVVEAISQHPEALILADYRIGDLNGEELLQRVQSASLTCPVILMSSLNDDSMRARCLRAGAAYFLRKPYAPTELLEVLVNLFGNQPSVSAQEET